MKYKYLGMLMLGSCMTATAQDAKPKEADAPKAKPAEVKPKSLAEQMKEVMDFANHEQNLFMKKVRAEKDRKKAMELYRTERPSMKPHIEKVIALAKLEPATKEAATGLAWAYQRSQKPNRAVAIDLLLKHHKDSELMGKIVYSMSRSYNADLGLIRKIMYSSNNEKVRQTALLTLASACNKHPDKKAEALSLFKQLMAWPGIETSNARLVAHVKQEIFVLENLSIGKAAPEIIGMDQDDKEFKLSDYKGKVVLLDFWGIW